MTRPHLRLKEGQWNLWRLRDEEFTTFVHNSVRIMENYTVTFRLGRRQLTNGRRISLGEVRIVLERRFGASSFAFDGYRGSFCFPLLLTFDRAPRLKYLVRVHDCRGTIFVPLFRVMDREVPVEERTHARPPFSNEFPRAETATFTTSFFAFVLAGAESLGDSFVEPFCCAVDRDLVLYGYENGQFFERTYAEPLTFAAARAEVERRLGHHRPYELLVRDRWTGDGAMETSERATATCRRRRAAWR